MPDRAISPKQERFLTALLTHATIQAAAEASQVPIRTARRWLKEPAFEQAYRAARSDLVTHAMSIAQRLTAHAIAILGEIMRDSDASPAARVSAASKIIDISIKGLETDEILERIEKLEAQLEQSHIRTTRIA